MRVPTPILLSSLVIIQASYASFYDNKPLKPPLEGETSIEELERKFGGDLPFTGIQTLFHLPHVRCLTTPPSAALKDLDIAVIGFPFDTFAPHRSGSRFGPRAIRSASSRPIPFESLNTRAGLNPFLSWAEIVDCGDVPLSPFDEKLAIRQAEEAAKEVLGRWRRGNASVSENTEWTFPRLISLGGGREVLLPVLKAVRGVLGKPVTVVHFGAHGDCLDNKWLASQQTQIWPSTGLDSSSDDECIFELASSQDLIDASSSVLAGLRGSFADYSPDHNDNSQSGFIRIDTNDIEAYGAKGIAKVIMDHVGSDRPVYISIDISVLDPGTAPGTGMPEPGGWTMREMIQILRGIENLNVVGAAVLEVNPAYDDRTQSTALAGSQIAFEILTSIVKRGSKLRGLWDEEAWKGTRKIWKSGRSQVEKGFLRARLAAIMQDGS